MIHAISASQIPSIHGSEGAIRILSLAKAYGDESGIVQYYTDDVGGYAALFDGTAIVHRVSDRSDEWVAFFSFVPHVRAVRCDVKFAQCLSQVWNRPVDSGVLMSYDGARPAEQQTETSVRLDDLYPLLKTGFPSMPPFDSWYVDVSHRIRHGHCHLACISLDGSPVSSAMTVAEAGEDVLLGAVVTDPNYRHRGLAGRCVLSLVRRFYGRAVYIAPINASAAALYKRLGFIEAGNWAQVTR